MRSRLMILSLAVLLAMAVSDVAWAQGPKLAPARYTVFPSGSSEFGEVPPPIDLSYLKPVGGLDFAPAASWDWRALGGVTSVKNQNPYGTCWCFAALGNLEAKILIEEGVEYDYSELNLQGCNPVDNNCNGGGNAWMSTNYLSIYGSVMEACDPYPGDCPLASCINPACDFYKTVTEWRVIPNDVDAIKAAVMNYGPLYTSMYASFPGFSTYNGVGCLSYIGTEGTNHGVVIVGFDDDLCGAGVGGWIIKNSWGTSWGDEGYFYILYGNAKVGTNANVITRTRPYDPNKKLYYLDDWGWWSAIGYSDYDDWGLVELTPQNSNEFIYSLHFWAVSAPDNYEIYVYDDFNGTAPSNLIAGPFSGTKSNAGYYTIDLPEPIPVTAGDAFYIAARFNTPGYNYPIPLDTGGPKETSKSYISSTGAAGTWVCIDNGASGSKYGDIGLRATIGPEPTAGSCSLDGDPAMYIYTPGDTMPIFPGETIEIYLGPANLGTVSSCSEDDTFCVHVADTAGWTITSSSMYEEDLWVAAPECWIAEAGYYYDFYVRITAPCEAEIGDYNFVTFMMAYCDGNYMCAPHCGDCEDPNVLGSGPRYQSCYQTFEVVPAPPALYVLQDTLFLVEQGVVAAYVPFSICNGDPCAPPTSYNYAITSQGTVGGTTFWSGTATDVPGGECRDVYAEVDAGLAEVCDYDTLKIIVWALDGSIYDTCVQAIHIIEPVPVPLFSAAVLTVLALAMILAAAVILRRRAAGRA